MTAATKSADPMSDAADASARLTTLIADEIAQHGGWIRFSRFMELALYAPGLGYYAAGAAKVGQMPADGSDFTTAPELTPLFGRALARPVAEVLADGGDTIVELGGGSGRLAVDLLTELERLGRLPDHYLMLDVSADLRDRQRTRLLAEAPALADRVAWIERLPEQIDGVVIANEVLDALPVELVVFDGADWCVRGVACGTDGAFQHADRPLPRDLEAALADAGLRRSNRPAGYVTELHPAGSGLVASITERLGPRSLALWIDYGFPASEYYHSQRIGGTLMAHRAHRATPDVLSYVGRCDLTAHVDFSAIARVSTAAGGVVVGYASQAAFLLDCGIAELMPIAAERNAAWVDAVRALQTLLSEAEMGELFKVLAIGRRARPLSGFRAGDRRQAL